MSPDSPSRIVVVSHAMVQKASQKRWRLLAREYPVEVTLLVPGLWKSNFLHKQQQWTPEAENEGRFELRPIPVTHHSSWGRYAWRSFGHELRSLDPDVILVYGEELSVLLQQMILYRKLWAPQARLGFFTWNNIAIVAGRRRWLKERLWNRVCRGTDFAIAGNEEGKRMLYREGYGKPIFRQTEIGVDEEQFHPDPVAREKMRETLGLSGFVLGFVGRVTECKGVDDLFAALPKVRGEFSLLVVGAGDREEALKAQAEELSCPCRFAGFVELEDVPRYMQAMDALILPSRTTAGWKEQFGLVLPQAVLSGVPVLGSDSGAIPEVVGTEEAIFPERNPVSLAECVQRLLDDVEWRATLAQRQLDHVRSTYTTTALARQTNDWLANRMESL